MQIKKTLKTLNKAVTGFTIGIALFAGIFTAVAVFPDSPMGETVGGWLGKVFNLQESDSTKLTLNSQKIVLPANSSPISENKQVATKEYVDSSVNAGGTSSSDLLIFADRAFSVGGNTNFCLKYDSNGKGTGVNTGLPCDTNKDCFNMTCELDSSLVERFVARYIGNFICDGINTEQTLQAFCKLKGYNSFDPNYEAGIFETSSYVSCYYYDYTSHSSLLWTTKDYTKGTSMPIINYIGCRK